MTEPIENDPYLRARYGISKARFSRFPTWLITAILISVIGGGWLLWTANHYTYPEIKSTLISFREVDAKNIEIRYSIKIKNPNSQVICRLAARDYELNIVGQIDDEIPLGTKSATRIVQIPTRLAAVNAQIESCSTL
jgi:LEA14-like dessication related protein